jgi:hypothetical protein
MQTAFDDAEAAFSDELYAGTVRDALPQSVYPDRDERIPAPVLESRKRQALFVALKTLRNDPPAVPKPLRTVRKLDRLARRYTRALLEQGTYAAIDTTARIYTLFAVCKCTRGVFIDTEERRRWYAVFEAMRSERTDTPRIPSVHFPIHRCN